jgi:chemosensory pili system protein ChpA (sensor histidine kinase/response regulator)
MKAFGLDDVREAYTNDVTRFLAEVENNARAVASLAIPAERDCQVTVNSIVVGLHGIVGSSSLIGVDSMATTARRLENIAGSAAESVRVLKWHLTRLKRIAATCLDGAAELRVILEHELAGQTPQAQARSTAIAARLDSAVSALEHPQPERVAPEPVRAPAAFALGTTQIKLSEISSVRARSGDDGWDDAPAAPAIGEPGVEPDPELVDTFREEARETLHNLQGYWLRLAYNPADHEAAAQCARLLHLLKGAASTVGFQAIAGVAGELHAWFETARAGVSGSGAGAGVVGAGTVVIEQLGRGIEDLVEQTLGERPKLPRASGDRVPGAVADAADDEPRQIFLDEARRALDELWSLTRQVAATSGIARGVAAGQMERLFHRLKGSALIVGDGAIADIAERGQVLCDALEQVDPVAVEALVHDIAARVGRDPDPAAGDTGPHRVALPPAEEWDAFVEESSALLDDLDRVLAKLEQSPKPVAELTTLFRMYHTLKGAASSVGLPPVGQQLHIIETFVERTVAAPALPDLRQVAAALASEHAAMRASIARATQHSALEVDLARTTARLAAIRERSASSWIAANDPAWASSDAVTHGPESSRSHASTLEGEPAAGDEASGRRYVRVAADRLDGLLDLVGELVVARSRILTRVGRLQQLQDDDQQRHGAVVRHIDDFVTATEFVNLDGRRSRLAAVGGAGFGIPQRRSRGDQDDRGEREALGLDRYDDIHVLARQLDESAGDITEMRREIGAEMQHLTEDAEALGTIVTDLQTEITQARMLAIETLFTRLQLPIRDAAQRMGRDVEIVTRGEDVAIDKAISDVLFGPLLHIVRNAVVHGIEPAARRIELGKPRAGTISLVARQDHGQVVLEVSDDGRGIDVARLKAIGVEKGLIDPAIPDGDPRVLDLVFVHGVSTSGEAGQLAGRGVGGNVIRRAVDRLNGSIEIATDRDTGTTFRITLPLSLSITQALVVRSAGVTLAIPLTFAQTILAREGADVVDTFGCMRAVIDGSVMPVHVTRRLFGDPGEPSTGVLVVCAVGQERIAIHADEVLGQEEIVVKSLGSLLDGHPLFSGSTQRGDGELVLILDVPGALTAETAVHAATTAAAPFAPRATQAIAASAPAAAPRAIAELAQRADKPRVLFVDDSLSVRKVAERMLASLGVEVVTAVDGQDALDKLRTTSFSLVFTDLEMPRIHGYELIREMQYLPAASETPVIVVSSRSGQKHVDQALGMGAREYLTKPFSPEILNGVLARWARLDPLS